MATHSFTDISDAPIHRANLRSLVTSPFPVALSELSDWLITDVYFVVQKLSVT